MPEQEQETSEYSFARHYVEKWGANAVRLALEVNPSHDSEFLKRVFERCGAAPKSVNLHVAIMVGARADSGVDLEELGDELERKLKDAFKTLEMLETLDAWAPKELSNLLKEKRLEQERIERHERLTREYHHKQFVKRSRERTEAFLESVIESDTSKA